MTLSLALGCLWLVLANVIAMFPSRRQHWPAAYALIATGLPLLIWIALADGPWIAVFVLVAAASVLRWPLRYLVRWILRRLGHTTRDA